MNQPKNFKLKKILTIAGSDSGGGAGMQADLKTFTALGVFGMSAITAVTAQNTVGVQGVYELSSSFVATQIDSVMDDIGADVIKIGMLANKEIINTVAKRIQKYNIKIVVLDPVMVAKSGDYLLQQDSRDALIQKLIPLSFVITPNLHEAKAISGIEIKNIGQMKKAAQIIFDMGAKNVVVKGGHLSQAKKAVDILFDGKTFHEFTSVRFNTPNTHGTGCTFASAVAAELAKGQNIFTAVERAKDYVAKALQINKNVKIGHGHGPVCLGFGIE